VIAYELTLRESTVKMYVGRLMRKLKATNRTEVALFGERLLKEPAASKSEQVENGDQVIHSRQPLQLSDTAVTDP
jgi:hypothetical protein